MGYGIMKIPKTLQSGVQLDPCKGLETKSEVKHFPQIFSCSRKLPKLYN